MSGCPDGDYTGLYCETAIHSVSTSNDRRYYNGSQLKSGAGANSRNTFDTCSTAIYSYTTLTTVNNNKVKNTNIGVYCREATSGSYVINSAFNNTSAGIKFINILPLIKKITIKYDSILNPTCGIYLSNVTSHATNLLIKTTVSNNYITNVKNSSVYGIRLEKCNYIEAYCNKIARTAIPATAYRLLIRGIHIEQCENALIHDNTSERIGLSIKGAGSLLGTQFKCNTSNGSYNGFYFDAAYGASQTKISDQGISTLPNDNKWYNVPTNFYCIDAATGFSITPLKRWYYRSVGTQYNPTISSNANYGINKFSAGNPTQSSCSSCGTIGMSGSASTFTLSETTNTLDSAEMSGIVNESNNYTELDVSFKYFEKQYAYHKLDANIAELNALTEQYYYDLKNGNIGKFDDVYRNTELGNIDDAMLLNNQIVPLNYIEQYRKWVNSVYFDYIVPQKVIPQATINDLQTLASTSPFVNGDAVYTARAIVGYTEPVVIPKNLENDDNNSSDITVKIYPNPAENNINVELSGIATRQFRFVIRNILGVKLLEKQIGGNESLISIDISNLNNGLYLYEIINIKGLNIKNGRLVISK